MKNKPAYGIESVDHALRLALLLRRDGALRVTDAAQRLGVARSTAHRLLAMLVYHDFAEQAADRRYAAGPVLRPSASPDPLGELRAVALPHLRTLVERAGETANLTVRMGAQVRFLATVECDRLLRVGDREGRMLPAHLTSGGRVLLAAAGDEELAALYPPGNSAGVELDGLRRALRQVRRLGYAVNNQATEQGVTAIGYAVGEPGRPPAAAISLAMPTARYSRARLPEWVHHLRATAQDIAADLANSAR